MKTLTNLFTLSLIVACYSCNGQYIPSHECIEYNNKGTDAFEKYEYGKKNELAKAIAFYKEAINCDSKYLMPYTSLATAYDYAKDYKQELNVYNKLLSFSKTDPIILTEKGVVFEKLKLLDSAQFTYLLAKQNFKSQIANQPNNANLISGYLLLLALTEGKDSAIKELDKRLTSNPELSSMLDHEHYFYQSFNKQAYIYHLSQQITLSLSQLPDIPNFQNRFRIPLLYSIDHGLTNLM